MPSVRMRSLVFAQHAGRLTTTGADLPLKALRGRTGDRPGTAWECSVLYRSRGREVGAPGDVPALPAVVSQAVAHWQADGGGSQASCRLAPPPKRQRSVVSSGMC